MNWMSSSIVVGCLCAFCGCSMPIDHSSGTCKVEDGRQALPPNAISVTHEQTIDSENRAESDRRASLLRERAETGWVNESALRDFALKESPRLWQTVQTIRAQVAVRRKSFAQLETDLREFNVDPAADADCRRLEAEVVSLLDSLSAVFGNLEEAYIASKKFELAPSNAECNAIMKRTLEEGAKEADNAAMRYRKMTNINQ